MNMNPIRRQAVQSCSKIAYDTTAAQAAGMAGLCRPSGGVSDRRGRIRREWEWCKRMWPPSEWTDGMWRQRRHVGGEVTGVAIPVEESIWSMGGRCVRPGPGWKEIRTNRRYMNRTGIAWCKWTWNPIVGCSPASSGCAHCYAAAMSRRFGLPWGTPHFLPEHLGQPSKVKTPARVFVCSMSDIAHPKVQPEWRKAIYASMVASPWHQYILLTKRPEALDYENIPSGTWVGVTVESQEYVGRWELLRGRWGGVAFVSVEPMLEPVTFSGCRQLPPWVIAGPETGAGARPCDLAWITALAAESACFFDKREPFLRREYPA